MKRLHLNLVLLVAAAGLGTAAYFAHQNKADSKKLPPLTAIAANGVSSAALAWPGKPEIKLEKQAGRWRLTAPVQGRADTFEMAAFSNLATAELKERLGHEGLDLKELGLDPPEYSVTLNGTRIDFGGTEPLNYRRYVRVNGEVGLIDDMASAAFDADYQDLVAKDLLASEEVPVKVELPELTLTLDAKGSWSALPASAAATPTAINALVNGWKEAKSMWNEAGGAAPAADAPRVRITLNNGELREFVVAARDPQLSLYSPALKIRYQLSKALEETLLKLPEPAKPAAAADAEPDAAVPTK